MTDDEIAQIESEFDVRLPNGYRQLLRSPPALLVALMDVLAQEHSPFEVPVFLKSDVIAEQNREVRDPDSGFVAGPEEDDQWDKCRNCTEVSRNPVAKKTKNSSWNNLIEK